MDWKTSNFLINYSAITTQLYLIVSLVLHQTTCSEMKHVKLIYSNPFCIILFTSWKPSLSVSDQVPIMIVLKQKLTHIPGVV